jgi:hypothetical protein
MEAMTPKQAIDLKLSRIPEKVFEAFNEAIADDLSNGSATVTQSDVITRILGKIPDITRQSIFDNGWLDVEPFYRKKGWKVEYDKPGFNESYGAYWDFRAKRK